MSQSKITASELAEDQQQVSIAQFFAKNKQMLGFDTDAKSVVTVVKEAVDNSLDAATESDILPDVSIEIIEVDDYYKIIVEDNGPGVTEEQVPKVFGRLLYGSRFTSRTQTRGQQGIGISASVLYGQMTSGKPTKVHSKTETNDDAYYAELTIDEDTNTANIHTDDRVSWHPECGSSHGTRIEVEIAGNMRAKKQLHNYIQRTAIVNPHANISYTGPNQTYNFERRIETIPPKPSEIKPHPHGVELGTLMKMAAETDSYKIKSFLENDFTRVGPKSSKNILNEFGDRFYGRDVGFPLSMMYEKRVDESNDYKYTGLTADLHQTIVESVNNKGKTATDDFATGVVGYLYSICGIDGDIESWGDVDCESDGIGMVDISNAIDTVSNDIEDEYDITIGDTVRNGTRKALFAELASNTTQSDGDTKTFIPAVAEIINDATSSRKGMDVARAVSEEIYNRMFKTLPKDKRKAEYSISKGVLVDGNVSLPVDNNPETINRESGETTVRTRFTEDLMDNILEKACDSAEGETGTAIGETAMENIKDSIWPLQRRGSYEYPPIDHIHEYRIIAQELVRSMRNAKVTSPPTDCLVPIGEDDIEIGMKSVYDAEMYATETRKADVYAGDPFIVEAGLAYGGELEDEFESTELLRFANRVPLVYQRGGCAMYDVSSGLNWRNYTGSTSNGLPDEPMVLLIHVASTNVPFTSESKDAVANVEEIEHEIKLAVQTVGRELKSHINEKSRLNKQREKQNTIGDIIPDMARKLANVTENETPEVESSVARILNNTEVRIQHDGLVSRIEIENHQGKSADLEIEISSDEEITFDESDGNVSYDDSTGSYTWSVSISKGENTLLTYTPGDSDANISISGIEDEKLTKIVG